MLQEKGLGACLVSQDIRERIKRGHLIGEDISEDQIQVSSFEPTIGDEVYILDAGMEGLFRPQAHERISNSLVQMPVRKRKRFSIAGGFEIKKGFTYLFPLRERIVLNEDERVISSPKSSFGRLFLNTRLLTDYNPCVDEMSWQYRKGEPLQMWLMVQPLTFNLIVYPGLSFNQLRFISGLDAKLTDRELIEECKKQPLLFREDATNSSIPAESIISDGLQLHLDVSGKHMHGIVGLRARHTPIPVDLKKIRGHDVEDFFEPVRSVRRGITIQHGEHYLLASKEILKIPAHLSAEVKSHSHILLHGPLHFAGFIDNGFHGNLVFEIRSDEITNTELCDGMPISKIDIYRAQKMPDKIYGGEGQNNYSGQVGITPSKFFKPMHLSF